MQRTETQEFVDAFVAAVSSLGFEARMTDQEDGHGDVVVAASTDRPFVIELKHTSLISTDNVSGQIKRYQAGAGVAGVVVVADRITDEARTRLTRAGFSWLDLRGHLRLTGPGVFIDADVPALSRPTFERTGFTGQVSLELAVLLLLEPERPHGVRAAAARLSRSPSSISAAYAALAAGGFVDENRGPSIPGLFWELAEHWKPVHQDVASVPGPGRGRDNAALGLGLEDVKGTTGWALTDTVAAGVYGAPVAMRTDYPRDFYVPDRTALRRATRLLGPALSSSARAGRVRVAPVPAVCMHRVDPTKWSDEHWPLAQPLFVALDLAQDPGRGAEVLESWTPRQGHRVW